MGYTIVETYWERIAINYQNKKKERKKNATRKERQYAHNNKTVEN